MTGYEMGHLEVPQQQHQSVPHHRSGSHSPWDSVEDLPEPVLPWMKTESRQSFGESSRNSVESNSLHVIKRYAPDPTAKKRQLWTARKWWILLANTLVGPFSSSSSSNHSLIQHVDVVILLWFGHPSLCYIDILKV